MTPPDELSSTHQENLNLSGSVPKSSGSRLSEWLPLSRSVVGTAKIYAANVIINTPRGHGFAAEKANHLYDKLRGRQAFVIGGDNLKDGADRLVNGVRIQSKYCATGARCIRECFDNGRFRYINPDGSLMAIEVPRDLYDDAVKSLADRIRNGDVTGVTDPREAERVVRRGHFTYAQARRIAQFGTVESVTFDALNGAVVAGSAAGLSASITLALALWNDENPTQALRAAAQSGLNIGGTAWVTSILSAQAGRTGVERGLRPISDWTVKQLGRKATRTLANGLRQGARPLSGAAASSHLSKVLRGNVVTSAITVAVLSSGDVYALFRRRVSLGQAFKNVTTTTASVAGGVAGTMGGAVAAAAVGTAVIPIPLVGTAIGFTFGLMGGLLGGSLAKKGTQKVLDQVIEDDAEKMLRVLEGEFAHLAEEFLLNQAEASAVLTHLQTPAFPAQLRQMHAERDRTAYARSLLVPITEGVIAKRPRVQTPSPEALLKATRDVLEQLESEAAD